MNQLAKATDGGPKGPGTQRRGGQFLGRTSRYVTLGMLTCALLIFGVGGWAAVAKLSSAVIATGQVVVSSNLKKVQHPDGGIVGEIFVQNGDQVEAGQLLLRLDETLVKANRSLLDAQLVALEARLARMIAERDEETDITLTGELAARMDEPMVQKAVEAERKVLAARIETREGQVSRLNERVDQLHQQIEGLAAQRDAKLEEVKLIEQELGILEDLFEQGHVPQNRIMALRRERTRLLGEHGELVSRIAMAKGRISETELEILQLDKDQREQTFSEITAIIPEIANLYERRTAADFQLTRTDITAPSSGFIHELAVHTVGGVVQAGETLMQIVPEADNLVIEARVAPSDVDQVRQGQDVVIVVSAFDRNNVPQLHGKVSHVSADLTRDEANNVSYYTVRMRLDEGELDRLSEADAVLQPGMPAEVYITTGDQTVLQYLVKPLEQQIRKTFREG